MSGHSKWSTIKHKKAANDAKRGKQFAKLIRAIETAARGAGTSDPSQSPSLAMAVQKASRISSSEGMPSLSAATAAAWSDSQRSDHREIGCPNSCLRLRRHTESSRLHTWRRCRSPD
jgi:transcriptional/translational regulatory protein YebC/TACO1